MDRISTCLLAEVGYWDMDGRIAVQAITPVIHHAQTSHSDNHREQGNVSSNPCWQNRRTKQCAFLGSNT